VFFVERTGIDKGNIRRTIARLRKWQMITKNAQFYEVLPPDQWGKEVFVETKNRFKSEVESPLLMKTASKLKRPEVEIEAVLASSKEHSSKERLSKEVVGGKPPSLGAETSASKYLFEKTGRKRWANLVQKENFEKVEAEVGEARMREAIDWALTSGISNIKSILTAAKKGGRDGQRPGTRRRDYKESSAARLRQSLE